MLGGAFVGTALAVFAGYGLATAELKQNEVAQRLEESAGATCSIIEGNCGDEADSEPVSGDVDGESVDVGEVPETTIDPAAEGAQVVDAVTTTEVGTKRGDTLTTRRMAITVAPDFRSSCAS